MLQGYFCFPPPNFSQHALINGRFQRFFICAKNPARSVSPNMTSYILYKTIAAREKAPYTSSIAHLQTVLFRPGAA
jgi:hypothetical protein